MTDREKVRDGLQRCADRNATEQSLCIDCPYYNDVECTATLMTDAAELLHDDMYAIDRLKCERSIARAQLAELGEKLNEKMDDVLEFVKQWKPAAPKSDVVPWEVCSQCGRPIPLDTTCRYCERGLGL